MLFLALLAPLLLLGNQVQAGGIGNLVKEIINQKFDSESQKSMSSDPKEQEEFKVTKEYIQAYFGEISPEIIDRYEVKLEAKKSKLQSKGRQLTPKEIKKSVKKAVKEIEKKIRKQVRKQKKVLENTGVAQIGNARM